VYLSLSNDNRTEFLSLFEHGFFTRLAGAFDRRLKPAYDEGFDLGWDLGADLCLEKQYRRGFAEGFNSALQQAARTSYSRIYAATYSRQYLLAFADWSNNPHPEVLYLGLQDHDRDGVFEPGETIRVDFAVTNYGGAGGEIELVLTGADLESTVTTNVALAPRARLAAEGQLAAAVRRAAEPSSLSLIELRAADSGKSKELFVAYPLRFDGPASLASLDVARGHAVIEATIRNQSPNRHQLAEVVLRTAPHGSPPPPILVGPIQPDAAATVRFELADLDAGQLREDGVEICVTLTQDGTTIDALAARLTATVE
jgi:hypothetical protein